MSKKSAVFAAVALCATSFSFISCDKIKDLVKVDVPVTTEIEFIIPVITQTGNTTFGSYEVPVDVNELIKSSNDELSIENIKSAKIESCIVTAEQNTAHPNDNFTALSAIKAEFASNTKTDFIEVASIATTPSNGYEIDVPVNSDLDVKDYMTGTTFKYRVSGVATRVTSSEIKCKAKIKFIVRAGLD